MSISTITESWLWIRSFGMCLLVAGVLLVINRQHTAKIAKITSDLHGKAISAEQAIKVFPDAASTELASEDESDWTLVRCVAGNLLGMVVNTSPFMDDVVGYAGPTPVLIGVDRDGDILAIELLDNIETPRFVRRVVSSGYLDRWLGLSYKAASTTQVDAVSSATMTCDAIATSIRWRLALIDTEPGSIAARDTKAFLPLGWRSVAIILLVVCGATLSLLSRSLQKLGVFGKVRYLVLAGSLGILGFASATMLSMSLLEALAKSGRMPGNAAIIVLVVLAVLVPLVSGKNFYCHCVCPFGGLQEFLFRISPVKVIKPRKGWHRFRRVRYGLLVILAASTLAGWGLSPDMQEPFAAFHWATAGWIPVTLASFALLLSSLGINRPWCTYCCSSGALLDLLRTKRKKPDSRPNPQPEHPGRHHAH